MKKIFRYPIKVSQEHIDSLNHVNNEVYIKWLLEAAGANSSSIGFTLDKFLSEEACFVVRRHEVDYLAPAFLDEELTVETWIEQMEATRSTRVYTIKRNKDDKTLIKAKTLWVYINLKNGRPIEIPEHVIESFSPYIHS
ncbi:MAG: acyl-CoA thioesterase [Pseudobdellovibrio sp.]